jgi:hypothetical protein
MNAATYPKEGARCHNHALHISPRASGMGGMCHFGQAGRGAKRGGAKRRRGG